MPLSGKSSFGKRPAAPGDVRPGDVEPGDVRPGGKRRRARTPTFKHVKILLSGHAELAALARNVSEDGCLVTVIGAEHLPDALSIRLDAGQPPRAAEVVWRAQGEAGLKFVKTE